MGGAFTGGGTLGLEPGSGACVGVCYYIKKRGLTLGKQFLEKLKKRKPCIGLCYLKKIRERRQRRRERKEGSEENWLDVVPDLIIILFSTFLSFSGKSVLISGVGWNLFFVICSKMSQLEGKKIQITNHLVSQARPGPELFPSSPLALVFLWVETWRVFYIALVNVHNNYIALLNFKARWSSWYQ